MYGVGTSPPHDLEILHNLVASNTHKLCVSYYAESILGSISNRPVINQTLCVTSVNRVNSTRAHARIHTQFTVRQNLKTE